MIPLRRLLPALCCAALVAGEPAPPTDGGLAAYQSSDGARLAATMRRYAAVWNDRIAGDPATLAGHLRTAFASAGARGHLRAAGALLAERGDLAAVVELLAQAGDTLLAADLALGAIVWTPDNKTVVRLPATLYERLAGLLADPDPVVQGTAEWALALAAQRHNADWTTHRNPLLQAQKMDWYRTWSARDPALRLSDDYARQLVQLDRHRLLPDIQAEGARCLARAAAAGADRARVQRLGQELAQATEPATARRLLVDLRLALRPLVLATSPLPREGVAFLVRQDTNGDGEPQGGGNINTASLPFTNKPGGSVRLKAGWDPALPARDVVAGRLGQGDVRGLDVWWDGDRAVFGFLPMPADPKAPYGYTATTSNLYEVDLVGDALARVTEAPRNNDREPCYLPDGGIVFVSDRTNYGNQCAGDFIQDKRCTSLYRLSADRKRLKSLSNNKDFDRHPHVTDDGTVVFTHWEYQERHFYELHALWTCMPDGCGTDAFYKQHIGRPMSMREARQVPGTTRFVATAQGHHDMEYGPLVVIDIARGRNNRDAMRLLTTGCSPFEGGLGTPAVPAVEEGGVENFGGRYAAPFAVSPTGFLASGELSGNQLGFALYYLDVHGNRELVHREPLLSVQSAVPLGRRPKPPVLPDRSRPEATTATVFVQDVYADLPGVARGAAAAIRISQSLFLPAPPETTAATPWSVNHLHWLPGCSTSAHFGYWTWSPTRVVGTVPVASDGSAHFEVPPNLPVFFQLLDHDGCEIRRMRTNVTLQRGERRGCVGCHETKNGTPAAPTGMPEALRKPPVRPVPPAWGDTTLLGYDDHIQPIFDRRCVSCHGSTAPAGGVNLTARRIGGFAQGYRSLFGLKPDQPTPAGGLPEDYTLIFALHPGTPEAEVTKDKTLNKKMQINQAPGQLVAISNRHDGAEVTKPYQFGSTQSRLVRTLRDAQAHPQRAGLTDAEWTMLVTWIDLNAVYHNTVIDKSIYEKDKKTLTRVPYALPSPWELAPDDSCGTPGLCTQAR